MKPLIMRGGWRPDTPDPRDRKFTLTEPLALPDKVDLRSKMPSVYDQGDLGSCTANAIAGALEYEALKQGEQSSIPSRLFIYYNERVMEHTVSEDAGASLRDGIKSVAKIGAPDETYWPYDISRFADKPSDVAYKNAKQHEALAYYRVLRGALGSYLMKAALAKGMPFVFGMTVFNSFLSRDVAKTGVVPMPLPHEQPVGGHALLAVGYEYSHFIVRNSWSEDWGDKGYCYIPEQYLLNNGLANDFWVVSKVT